MIKRAFLLICAITLSIMITAGLPVSARAPEFTVSSEPGDVWVYNGAWCYWSDPEQDSTAGLAEQLMRFLQESDFYESAQSLSNKNPLTGLNGSQSVFVLDSTPLYFESSAPRDIYGFGELNIVSGAVSAETIRSASGIYIGQDCEIYVLGEINTGGAFECFGAIISAGDVYASKIWLDSSLAPLNVKFSGSVYSEFYTQCGGSVKIGGGLFTSAENIDGFSALTVNNEYAKHNAAELTVGDNIASAGGGGRIEIGGGTAFGLFDEVSFTAYTNLRSNKKYRVLPLYSSDPVTGNHIADKTAVTAGGNIMATRSIDIYSGSTSAGGEIKTYTPTGAVRVYGGVISQDFFS